MASSKPNEPIMGPGIFQAHITRQVLHCSTLSRLFNAFVSPPILFVFMFVLLYAGRLHLYLDNKDQSCAIPSLRYFEILYPAGLLHYTRMPKCFNPSPPSSPPQFVCFQSHRISPGHSTLMLDLLQSSSSLCLWIRILSSPIVIIE